MKTSLNTQPSNPGKARVLVVDHIQDDIDFLHDALYEQYQVITTINAVMALDIAWEQQPDIILLGISTQQPIAYEICEKLKNNPGTHHIPVIFVCEKNYPHSEDRGLNLGAIDYIHKPTSVLIVRRRINLHLENAQRNRQPADQNNDQVDLIDKTRPSFIQRLYKATKFKHSDTDKHVVRISYYAREVGLAMGLDDSMADLLMKASSMHDIGIVGIPDQILTKQGKLTEEEFEVIKTHPKIGVKIIGDGNTPLLSMARDIAHYHHEKWNGGGYPAQLRGAQIPLSARIVAIVDVFDALTSERPHKAARPLDQTINIIRSESGKHFDPEVVDAFFEALPKLVEIRNTYHD